MNIIQIQSSEEVVNRQNNLLTNAKHDLVRDCKIYKFFVSINFPGDDKYVCRDSISIQVWDGNQKFLGINCCI